MFANGRNKVSGVSYSAAGKKRPLMDRSLFKSFLIGGFECSSHRRRDGRRLDLIDATGHDRFAVQDYAALAGQGILTARDGLRWHLIEPSPGSYDFSSIIAQIDAAQEAGVQVIWDLFHYGYPDDLDIFGGEFVRRFADLAAEFVSYYVRAAGQPPFVIPINEISFFSWIAGDIGQFYPFERDRGGALKRNLVKASIAAARAMKSIAPKTVIASSEPLVFVKERKENPHLQEAAASYGNSQFEAIDMLTGKLAPELGGGPDCVEVTGFNYYPHNQWYYPDREMIPLSAPDYKPLRHLLAEAASRYDVPVFISETGTEDDERSRWFRYIADECEAAFLAGVNLQGICLYPIVNHPGWEDDRHCHNGLWDYADEKGERSICEPLAHELIRYRALATAVSNG